jgi:hypothetical protein
VGGIPARSRSPPAWHNCQSQIDPGKFIHLTLFRDVSMATSSTAPMHFAGTAQRGKNWWVLGRSRLREEVGCPFLPALPCTLPSHHTCPRHPESMTRKHSDCSLSQESVQPSIHSSCWRNRLENCIIGTSFCSSQENNYGPTVQKISARSERSFYKSDILSLMVHSSS